MKRYVSPHFIIPYFIRWKSTQKTTIVSLSVNTWIHWVEFNLNNPLGHFVMPQSSHDFLLGRSKSTIEILKNTLRAKGLNESNFNVDSIGNTYLNLEGTLLTCEVEGLRYGGDHSFKLYFQGEQIARSTYSYSVSSPNGSIKLDCNWDKLDVLPNLIDQEFLKREKDACIKQENQIKLKTDAKTQFMEKHSELYRQAKSGFFGFFRKTKINPNWSLKDIIEHGMAHDNRTRQTCIALGWLTKDGSLSNDAPEVICQEIQGKHTLSK